MHNAYSRPLINNIKAGASRNTAWQQCLAIVTVVAFQTDLKYSSLMTCTYLGNTEISRLKDLNIILQSSKAIA